MPWILLFILCYCMFAPYTAFTWCLYEKMLVNILKSLLMIKCKIQVLKTITHFFHSKIEQIPISSWLVGIRANTKHRLVAGKDLCFIFGDFSPMRWRPVKYTEVIHSTFFCVIVLWEIEPFWTCSGSAPVATCSASRRTATSQPPGSG